MITYFKNLLVSTISSIKFLNQMWIIWAVEVQRMGSPADQAERESTGVIRMRLEILYVVGECKGDNLMECQ